MKRPAEALVERLVEPLVSAGNGGDE